METEKKKKQIAIGLGISIPLVVLLAGISVFLVLRRRSSLSKPSSEEIKSEEVPKEVLSSPHVFAIPFSSPQAVEMTPYLPSTIDTMPSIEKGKDNSVLPPSEELKENTNNEAENLANKEYSNQHNESLYKSPFTPFEQTM